MRQDNSRQRRRADALRLPAGVEWLTMPPGAELTATVQRVVDVPRQDGQGKRAVALVAVDGDRERTARALPDCVSLSPVVAVAEPGDRLWLRYLGWQTSSNGRMVRKFEVARARGQGG